LANSDTVAVLVTRRVTDQRKASDSSDGEGMTGVKPSKNLFIGACLVSAWARPLATCSAQAMNRSFSSAKLPMPRASASAINEERM
jgi:hypothetical protein